MEQTPARRIQALGLHEKVDAGRSYGNFSSYFDSNPEAIGELAGFLGQDGQGLTPKRLATLAQWLGRMDVDLKMGQDTMLDSRQALATLTVGNGSQSLTLVATGPIQATDSADEASLEEMAQAESRWFKQGAWAPVVVVEFRGQWSDERTGDIIASTPESTFCWDGTLDFLALPPEHRNGACEMDCEESDQLRESRRARKQARDWDGPFAVNANLAQPSALLASLRKSVGLSKALARTPARKPTARM